MLVYKIDVIDALKQAGYNSTVIWRENILSQSVMQRLRNGEMVGMKSVDRLCSLLSMQPADLIEYREDEPVH